MAQSTQTTLLHRDLRLRHLLGRWLCSELWGGKGMVLPPSNECLFQQIDGSWMSFSQIHKRDRLPNFVTRGVLAATPPGVCRATIYQNRNRLICTGYSTTKIYSSEMASNFLQYLQQADKGKNVSSIHGYGWQCGPSCIPRKDHCYLWWLLLRYLWYGSLGPWKLQLGWTYEGGSNSTWKCQRPGGLQKWAHWYCLHPSCSKKMWILSHLGCDGQSALAFGCISLICINDTNYYVLQANSALWVYSPI